MCLLFCAGFATDRDEEERAAAARADAAAAARLAHPALAQPRDPDVCAGAAHGGAGDGGPRASHQHL